MKKLTTEEFIRKAREVHGEKYDYSKVNYVNSTTPIKLICLKHGEFWIKPVDHIHSKVGCVECTGNQRSTTEQFIEKAKKIYDDKYDYSKVNYINNKTKVCIICHEKNILGEEHGEFWQRPNDHLSGYSCPKCGNNHIPTTDEWIAKAQKVHGNRYDYSKVNYIDSHTKVCIICPIHGEFWQIPNNHLNGADCPFCNCNNKSKMEEGIAFLLENNNIKYIRQKTFKWLKNKRNLFLDFYLPKYKIAIEVQGEQHFTPIEKFGGKEFFLQQNERDIMKKQLCEKNDIKIFYITKKNYTINNIIDFINDTTNKE